MIDSIKRIAEGVIESGKQCSVYTGEITSIAPLIIKISDELSLSTQLVVTGRVQTMLNDGDLIVGNSVALLRYQGGQNFLVMDEMDATTPNDWDSMAVINLQNHMEDLIKHITPAERTLWNENADNVPLQNHISDNVRHIFDWERTAWNEAVSNIPLNNHIADNVKHVTGDERTAWAKNVVDLDTHIGDQIKHITSEMIKMKSGSADLKESVYYKKQEVKGRNCASGLPEKVTIAPQDISFAIQPVLHAIVEAIISVLEIGRAHV